MWCGSIHVDLRIGALAGFARQHEGHDARDIGLIGDSLQIKHQRGVLFEALRDALRRIHGDGRFATLRFSAPRDALLDFANVSEVVVQARVVARPEIGASDARHVVGDAVENAHGLRPGAPDAARSNRPGRTCVRTLRAD